MVFENKVVKIVAVIALLLVVIAVALYFINRDEEIIKPVEDIYVPTPNQLLLGIKYETKIDCDFDTLEKNILSDLRFSGLELRDEYCMVYQITDEKSEKDITAFLKIQDSLPEVNYTSKTIVLAVGRELEELSDKNKRTDDDGNKIFDISYGGKYSKNSVYVYSMNKIEFLSGLDLEEYYWEHVDKSCNFVEGKREDLHLLSEGKYHKVYSKPEGIYEYILYSEGSFEAVSRYIGEERPQITEYTDTMVFVRLETTQKYYNPKINIFSGTTKHSLIYLINDIVAYVRVYNNSIILVVRDVYDSSKYGYSFYLPFTYDVENYKTVLKSIEVVDNTHLFVEYYTGTERRLVQETLTVANMSA